MARGVASTGKRPGVVAIDGRGASGKSTLAAALSRVVPGAALVHTDDVAWHHVFFDWADLLCDGVLIPAHAGLDVQYRPPTWEARGREGATLVQADTERAKARALVRDGGTPEVEAFWDEWMAEEVPFFARERPWERASTIASGMPQFGHDPAVQAVVVART
ncbi:hypothetical protein [Deinococcus sp.]|uniref:hypothetical protein n=1 Tax=Deinococcus sp. TaxID=47478 RepID=UPI002869A003|nr:hypothetical protein [Deinococcus sp.]